MGAQKKQGKNSVVHTVGKNPAKLVEENMENDGKFAVQTDEDTQDESSSCGRTISLGDFQFARVNTGIGVGLPFGADKEARDLAHDRMEAAIDEVLDREEAFIRGQDRVHKYVVLNGLGVKISIWLDYGLTLKGKGRDSHKFDISSSRYLSDGSDFEAQIEELSKEVGERVGKRKKKVLGINEDVGF